MADTKPPTPSDGYEQSDAHVGSILRFGVAFVIVLAFSGVAAWLCFDVLAARANRNDPKVSPLAMNETPPEPRLLVDEPQDLGAVRKEEEEILDSYGWVDKERGVVRIPIERAIELLAKEGLPSRAEGGKAP